MIETVFLLKLLEAFLSPSFGPEEAVAELGQPVAKNPSEWRLRASVPGIVEARLHFEDLQAGKELLTTIELSFRPPWKPTIGDLQRTFGSAPRWLPATAPGRQRRIAFDFYRDGRPLGGVIMLGLEPSAKGRDLSDMTVTSALVRRFFPTPAAPEAGAKDQGVKAP